MALVGPTLLTADPDTTNAASYVTPSVSPTAGAGLLVGVWNSDGTTAIQPTLTSGFAITGSWTTEVTILSATSQRRLTLFSATASGSPGSGTITADYGGDAQTGAIIIAVEYTGQDTSDFVLQPASNEAGGAGATSLAITLAGALGAATNQICAFIGHNTNEAQTAGGGGTQLASSDVGYTTPDARLSVVSEVNDNSVSASWTTSSAKLAVACEVVEATGGGGGPPAPKKLAALGVG